MFVLSAPAAASRGTQAEGPVWKRRPDQAGASGLKAPLPRLPSPIAMAMKASHALRVRERPIAALRVWTAANVDKRCDPSRRPKGGERLWEETRSGTGIHSAWTKM